jgi:serine/threonine protein phosphatase PrpC
MTILTPSCRLISHGSTHIGYVRQRNEDAILDMPKAGLWAVADGMGGHAHGDIASQSVISALRKLGATHTGLKLVERMPFAVQQVNRELQEWGARIGRGRVIGSTVAVLVLEDQSYHCFWAGDSRIYLWRGNALRRLTRDHTELADRLSRGLPEQDAQQTLIEANTLTRAVGAEAVLALDYVCDDLYEGDLFMLCSDGLTKVLDDAAIACLLGDKTPDDVCDALIKAALQGGGPDNVSCVTVFIG